MLDHRESGIDAPCTFGSVLIYPYDVTATTRRTPLLSPIPACPAASSEKFCTHGPPLDPPREVAHASDLMPQTSCLT